MKVCVIGGGGRDGIRTIAKLQRQYENGISYNVGIGVSTGAMMVCKVLLGDFKDLYAAYSTVTNKEVYKEYPFTKKGDISLYSVTKRSALGHATIGDMSPILKLIKKWMPESQYLELQNSGKRAVIGVLNVTTGMVEYKCSDDHDYWEFIKFIAAASTPELLGNYWNIDDWEYGDAGLATLIPITKALEYEPTVLDVYTHRPFKREVKNGKQLDIRSFGKWEVLRPMINSVSRLVRIYRESLEHLEIKEGVKTCIIEGVEPTVYYQDSKFKGGNPMVMDPGLMKSMYDYEYKAFGISDIRVKFTKENYKEVFKKQDR